MFGGMKGLIGMIVDYCHADIHPLYAHQSLDVLDTTGHWCEAQIISPSAPSIECQSLDQKANRSYLASDDNWQLERKASAARSLLFKVNMSAVRIHFKGWKAKFDETLDLSPTSLAKKRIALLHSHTGMSRFATGPLGLGRLRPNYQTLKPGMVVQCLDPLDQTLPARILEIREIPQRTPPKRLCLITYIDWHSSYDEWIDEDSYRILSVKHLTVHNPSTQSLSP